MGLLHFVSFRSRLGLFNKRGRYVLVLHQKVEITHVQSHKMTFLTQLKRTLAGLGSFSTGNLTKQITRHGWPNVVTRVIK
ncbi:hypothetical protein GDO86_014673 [Hymenochirus boettgeri]|uniref:Uncharacterized protein n=1 Tax=Hymenochirus boettgeri TaxID=247094 RepID=A0A8T2JVI9_9PIPI|nr:hypothetical protein GDO86_014673 [Hymenochirus boettgeri]